MDGVGGRRIADRFVLTDVLGRGGMGTVWQAQDTLLDRVVAIKEVDLGAAANQRGGTELREKVLREARLAARLNHPGAVTVFDAVESDGQVFIVMELVRAETLADLVRRQGPLPPARVAEIGLRVLDVLAAAHELGIVHRDVKPGNIMVAEDGTVKLADFGIARLDGGDATATVASLLIGSPAFMAPEHIRSAATAASDLWALGATLYHAVVGVSPFQRDSPGASLAAVLAEDPPFPARAGAVLGRLLLDVLAKDPEQRPSVAELRRRLGEAGRADGAAVSTVDADAARTVVVPPRVSAAADAPPVPAAVAVAVSGPPGPPRRDLWLMLAGVLCLVALPAWGVASLVEQRVVGGGTVTLTEVAKRTTDNALAIFTLFRGGGEVLEGKLYTGATGSFEMFALTLVSVLWLVLLPTGFLLLDRWRQRAAAAFFAASAVVWVPLAVGYGQLVFAAPPSARRVVLLAFLARALPALAALIAAVRALAAVPTRFRFTSAHQLPGVVVAGWGVVWVVVDAVVGFWPFPAVVPMVTALVLILAATLLGPHLLGAWALTGFAFVLVTRTAVDALVLVRFGDLEFPRQQAGAVEPPTAFGWSVGLGIALTVGALAVAGWLARTARRRANGVRSG